MSLRSRLLLLILFATLIPALVAGMQFLERRDAEIAAARQGLAAAGLHVLVGVSKQDLLAAAQLLRSDVHGGTPESNTPCVHAKILPCQRAAPEWPPGFALYAAFAADTRPTKPIRYKELLASVAALPKGRNE